MKFEHRFSTPKIIEIDHTQISHLPKVMFGTNSSHGVNFASSKISGSTYHIVGNLMSGLKFKTLFIVIMGFGQEKYSVISIWPRGYKTFSMLDSAEHKIYPAPKC